jgi:hypothetical protein
MAEKKFDKFFIANLKRTAQMVSPMVREKSKLTESIAEMQEKIAILNDQIDALDSHIRRECNYGVEELIIREVVDTGKVKDGKPIKVTKWNLRYPDTIIPPVENSNINNSEESQKSIESWQ